MVDRIQKLSKSNDLFLFGARGTGKSTLIHSVFDSFRVLWIDLLTEESEERFGRHPDELSRHLAGAAYDYVVIDEIQKNPKLLDVIHSIIETKKKRPYFILTGSSARKLKRDGANLLGGRAFTYHLFPFTHQELGTHFNLNEVLQFGSLPLAVQFETDDKKEAFLRGYVRSYLKEEILVEQIVRQIEPFKDFLEVAAQMNGEIINYAKISRDVGVSDQTVKSFYSILEDTLVGVSLMPFHRSIRKRQREAPKFYIFDTGVKRALSREIKIPLHPGTSEFGRAFESFMILEIFRACEYLQNDFRLSYLRTKDDVEIDVIMERPGQKDLLLEIKSASRVTDDDVRSLKRFLGDWDRPVEAHVWSLDPLEKKIEGVHCLPWQIGFKTVFGEIL